MRVLIGYLINGKSSGIDKYVLRMLDTLKDQDIQFDCLTTEKTEELETVMKPYGIGLIECPSLKNPLKQYQFFCSLIEKHRYDEVYINISEAFNSLAAFAAHRCHVRRIVIHSHNTQVGGGSTKVRWVRKLLHMVFRPLVKQIATDCCACSDDAGRWMFTGAYQVIPNAVDSSLFVYDERVRERVRKALQLDGKLVVGHVGRCIPDIDHYFCSLRCIQCCGTNRLKIYQCLFLRIPLRIGALCPADDDTHQLYGCYSPNVESRINDRFVLRPYWYDIRTYPHS